jgi:hypothetical protein
MYWASSNLPPHCLMSVSYFLSFSPLLFCLVPSYSRVSSPVHSHLHTDIVASFSLYCLLPVLFWLAIIPSLSHFAVFTYFFSCLFSLSLLLSPSLSFFCLFSCLLAVFPHVTSVSSLMSPRSLLSLFSVTSMLAPHCRIFVNHIALHISFAPSLPSLLSPRF